MKKILPILLSAVVLLFLTSVISPVYAQPIGLPSPVPAELEGKWVADPEVTFIGKTATRSNDFLNWTLQNYNWLCVQKVGDSCNNGNNPLQAFWQLVLLTVYAVMFLFVIISAIVMVVTRGQNLTIMRFVMRFIFIFLLVTFSFAIIQFVYVATDVIQGWLLRVPPTMDYISSRDLLFIDFDYTFTGFRKLGQENDESAFITLLLVKLTAITYYVMSGILIVRKIILWFFLIVSPIFPLLIMYRPIRNTAKIWVGEFFRWVLYAPLFALFLRGLVVMWRDKIPLPFDFSQVGTVVYPTAVNILIGGPGQTIGITNSVNLKDTFAQYLVALIMLWVVILLPFLLLRIFLDYLNSLSIGNNMWIKQAVNRNLPFLTTRGPSPGPLPPPPPPGKVFPAGMAKTIPFTKRAGAAISKADSRVTAQPAQINTSELATNEVLKTVNISIPKMRDIAKYETAILSKDISKTTEVAQLHETLEKIANPNVISTPLERERFSTVKERLVEQKSSGNPVANSVLTTVSHITNNTTVVNQVDTKEIIKEVLKHIQNPTTVVMPTQREKLTTLKEQLTTAKSQGDPVATTVLTTAEKVADPSVPKEEKEKAVEQVQQTIEQGVQQGNQVATQLNQVAQSQTRAVQPLPTTNRVQQVSIEEFEEVRKMWVENYEKLEPPRNLNGEQFSREQWIKNDMDKINEAISLLATADQQKVAEGMQIVSGVLPFLLMGGFSKSEVVTYLKAKLEAAQQVMKSIDKRIEDEETLLDARQKQERKADTMKVEISEEDNTPDPRFDEDAPQLKEFSDQNSLDNEKKPE